MNVTKKRYSNNVMKTLDVAQLIKNPQLNKNVSVVGWIKSNRDSGKIAFIELNDGTSVDNLQIVYKMAITKNFDEIKTYRTSSAVLVSGVFQSSNKSQQQYEILANEITLLKIADEDYPLQKKQHSLEFLREIAHLRPRTSTISAIMRVRSKLAYIIHKFFQSNGFLWVSAPIISANDAEGAGENFNLDLVGGQKFFDKPAKLTVSGQLNAEAYAQSFKYVYTFGPTFRAERSHTNRHMAEFWMIEPEIAFIDLQQLMLVIETFIKTIVKNIKEECEQEIKFFANEKPFITERIDDLIRKDFKKLDYSQAIFDLQQASKNGFKFEDNNIFFGKDLASEHERYLCEHLYKGPVFLYNFPKEIKAFYMKLNNDNKTVAACDLLVPGVGEIIGGSQREDDYQKLMSRSQDMKIDISSIQWYLDLRKYGYYSSAGFGLGFERLIMYILGLENIRETIPFPRTEGELKF